VARWKSAQITLNPLTMKIKHLIIGSALCALSTQAFALGQFSRACNLSTVPPETRDKMLFLALKIGSPFPNLLAVSSLADEELARHWILESITTDWGEARYYLFAEADVYRISFDKNYQIDFWQKETKYRSHWDSKTMHPDMKYSTRVGDILKHNRGMLFSARAGDPHIIQRFGDSRLQIKVKGKHSIFNPREERPVQLSDTEAQNCNLTQWGIEWLSR
jgi:hypothetical protein